MDLKRMRRSKEFAAFLEPAQIEASCKKLDFRSYFGDQDWWNMVVWSAPHMRYNLDCGFNFQVSQDFNNDIMDEVKRTHTKSIFELKFQHGIFKYYHSCKSPVIIKHGHDKELKI